MVPSEAHVAVRLTGQVKAGLVEVLAVLMEADLWPEWVPKLEKSETLAQPSLFSKAVHVRTASVGPIAAREVVLMGHGYDLLEQGAALVLTRDVVADEVPVLPTPSSSAVPLRLIVGGVLLMPVDEKTTTMLLVGCADPSLPVIPSWLVNFVVKHMAHSAFEMLASRAQNLPAEYRERIAANRKVYAEIERRVREHFDGENK